MRNIKLTIEYDGTNYSGWQVQENGPSIQEEIEKALGKITGEKVRIVGSGRTDAGVHARGQTASFRTVSRVPAERFSYALNSMLPRDIVINDSCEVPLDFHARYSAKGKKYSYLILNSKFPSALLRNYAYHINYCERLDIGKLRAAAGYFIGTYDFSGFMSAGSSITDTVRTIYELNVSNDGELIKLEYKGSGFLYNMVRILAGTLIAVGSGKLAPGALARAIQSKNRLDLGPTAPANGLTLMKVYYPDDLPEDDWLPFSL
jgi:tRNA pseudouridine38-40 synthase